MGDCTNNIPEEFLKYNTAYSDELYQKLHPVTPISNDDIVRLTSNNFTSIDELLDSNKYNNHLFLEILKLSAQRSTPWFAGMQPYINCINNNANKMLKAFPVPSPKMNSNCKILNGKSLWNSEGFWCCLLPNYNSDPDWWTDSNKDSLYNLLTVTKPTESIDFSNKTVEINPDVFDESGRFFIYDKELIFKYPKTYLDGILFKDYNSYIAWKFNLLKLIEKRNVDQVFTYVNQQKIWSDEVIGNSKKIQWDSLFLSSRSGIRDVQNTFHGFDDTGFEKMHRDSKLKHHDSSYTAVDNGSGDRVSGNAFMGSDMWGSRLALIRKRFSDIFWTDKK